MSTSPTAAAFALGLRPVPLVALDRTIVGVLLLVVGLLLLRGVLTTYRTTRLIDDTPTETVRSLAAGRTEVEGSALPKDESLPQPFQEGEAVVAGYEISRYDEDAEGDEPSWVTTERGTVTEPFHVDDGTGQVEVAASDEADLHVSDENTTRTLVGRGDVEPRPIREFLAEHTDRDVDPEADDSIYRRKHRYEQEVIPPGEDVYVFGNARPREAGSGGDEGERGVGESESGVDESWAGGDEGSAAGASNAERLVIEGDDETGRFIVSDMEQEALSQGIGRRIPVLFVLGLVLATVGFRLLLIELGVG